MDSGLSRLVFADRSSSLGAGWSDHRPGYGYIRRGDSGRWNQSQQPWRDGACDVITDEQGGYRFNFLPPGATRLSSSFQVPGAGARRHPNDRGIYGHVERFAENGHRRRNADCCRRNASIDVTNAVVATNFTMDLTTILPKGHDVFSVLAVTPGVQLTAPDVGGSRAGSRAQFRLFGSTSQWNVIEGAIMASLQYEDPDNYQEVQVAGAAKGADAPVGGSFNNFIVRMGGNKVHGLVFYDREPLRLQSDNLSQDLLKQGVTNTSSVARYQSFHGDVGGPFKKDKFWWYYGFRTLNSDNWTPGLHQSPDRDSQSLYSPRFRNHVTKLNYQLSTKHTPVLLRAVQHESRCRTPAHRPSSYSDSTSLTDFPYWIQGIDAQLGSIEAERRCKRQMG